MKAFIFIRTEKKVLRIDLSEIQYVKAMRDYTVIETSRGPFKTLTTFKSVADLLGEDFVRVHRSYLVPIARIERFSGGPDLILLDQYGCGIQIPIGPAFRKNLMRNIHKYMPK